MEGIERIFVISLARRRARLERFCERFPFDRRSCRVFAAIDGRTLNPEEPPLPDIWGPWLARQAALGMPAVGTTWGEAGCALSHLELWRRIAALPVGTRCGIFEDDAFFADRFRERWAARAAAGFPPDLGFAWVGGRFGPEFVPANVEPDSETEGFLVHLFDAGAMGDRTTHAYVITPSGAQQLCDTAAGRGLDRPLDVWLKQVGLRGLEPAVHTVSPLLCFSPLDYKSDIQGPANRRYYGSGR